MKDFASFTAGNTPAGSTPREGDGWVDLAQEMERQYRGKSEGELVKDIYARAVEGKRNGTLTNAEIDAFYAQVAPMLDGVKRKRLKKLVEELKSM